MAHRAETGCHLYLRDPRADPVLVLRRLGVGRRIASANLHVRADARVLQSPLFTEKGYLVGTRDRSDLSYERPLSMDVPAPARW